jgi:hypothetical protein
MVLLLAMELRRSEPEMGRGLVAAPLLNKLEAHHPLLEVKVGALPSTLSVPAQLDGGGRWGMDLEVGALLVQSRRNLKNSI